MWEKEVVGVGYMEHSQLPYFTSSLSQKIPRKLRVSSWDIFSNFNLFFSYVGNSAHATDQKHH